MISLEAMSLVVALALPLEVVPLITYLRGAITVLEEAFLRKVEGRVILSVGTHLSMIAPKIVEVSSQKEFIYTSICNKD